MKVKRTKTKFLKQLYYLFSFGLIFNTIMYFILFFFFSLLITMFLMIYFLSSSIIFIIMIVYTEIMLEIRYQNDRK